MVAKLYGDGQREMQDAFGTRPLADRVAELIVREDLSDDDKAFIASRDLFFLSTVNAQGQPTVSYKGGAPGFVRATDDRRLVFPSYDGNGMFLSLGNVAMTAQVGLLFIDFETPHRLRVQGRARVSTDADDLAAFPGAQAIVSVAVESAFQNCPRYVHRMARVGASPYVPDAAGESPVPAWKRVDAVQDVLSESDRDAVEANGGTIDIDGYIEKLKTGQA